MDSAGSADGSGMDRISSIGSPSPAWPARVPAGRDTGSNANAAWISAVEADPTTGLASVKPDDPAADKHRMLHFISHVDAECFISLLQTLDPLPDDYRARTEYRRRYRELKEVLELPPPPVDPPPVDRPTDLLR